MRLTLVGAFPYEGIKFGVYDLLRAADTRREQERGSSAGDLSPSPL